MVIKIVSFKLFETQSNKPRPRFVEALDSDEDSSSPLAPGKRETGSNGGGVGPAAAASSGQKRHRKSAPGGGKQSFFSGLGFPSAGGFRSYRFLGFGSGGEHLCRLAVTRWRVPPPDRWPPCAHSNAPSDSAVRARIVAPLSPSQV